MRGWSLLVVGILGGCVATQEKETPGPASQSGFPEGSARVYRADHGIRVAMVTPAEGPADQVLVRVTGSQTRFDDLVLRCRRQHRGRHRSAWATDHHGRSYWLVTIDHDRYEVHLPCPYTRGVALRYDEEESKALDAAALVTAHREQKAEGTLSAFADFDRKAEEKENDARLAEIAARVNQACGTKVETRIAWDSFTDAYMKKHAVSTMCAGALRSMEKLCKYETARKAFGERVREFACRYGDAQSSELDGGRWTATLAAELNGGTDKPHLDYLLQDAPLGLGEALQERIRRKQTLLCTDGKSHYVGLEPPRFSTNPIIVGDGKKFFRIEPISPLIGDSSFFDPREYDPRSNPDWRGADLRYWSEVEFDEGKKTCQVHCGSRTIPLQWIEAGKAYEILEAAEFTAPPKVREPYALARDRRGNYYYIDRTGGADNRDFHVYRGPKGNLKRLDMVNVVKDSEGDVFVTRSGTLRLVIEKQNSFWVQGKRSLMLMNLPIQDNLTVIYNELGVYLGVRLGTPCDNL